MTLASWIAPIRQGFTRVRPLGAIGLGKHHYYLAYEGDCPKVESCEDIQQLKSMVTSSGVKDAVGVLAPDLYQCFLMAAPEVKGAERSGAIRWKVADLIDYPIEHACVDYLELPQKGGTEAPMLYVVVSARHVIEQAVSVAHGAGVQLKQLTIADLGLLHMMQTHGHSKYLRALVMFEKGSARLLIMNDQQVLLIRKLELTLDGMEENPMQFSEHLGLQIQRSLDYCASTFGMNGSVQIHLQPCSEHSTVLSTLENQFGLEAMVLTQSCAEYEVEKDNKLMSYATLGAWMGRQG